jgi:hypothetical protein
MCTAGRCIACKKTKILIKYLNNSRKASAVIINFKLIVISSWQQNHPSKIQILLLDTFHTKIKRIEMRQHVKGHKRLLVSRQLQLRTNVWVTFYFVFTTKSLSTSTGISSIVWQDKFFSNNRVIKHSLCRNYTIWFCLKFKITLSL